MMVDVYMKDGQTIFRFSKRVALVAAIKREPLDLAEPDSRSLRAWVKWQRQDPEWQTVRVQHIAKGSIAFVVGVPGDEAQAFADARGVALASPGAGIAPSARASEMGPVAAGAEFPPVGSPV